MNNGDLRVTAVTIFDSTLIKTKRNKSMAVRAKFFVKGINHLHSTETCVEISMSPVYSGNEDNTEWSKFTPSGELKMLITNENAVEQFELGGEYYLDISAA